MGFEFGAAVVGCTMFGYWIGRHYEADRVGVIIGATTGIVGGGYNFIKTALKASANIDAGSHPKDENENDKGGT